MKLTHAGILTIFIGTLSWFIETAYFGFNLKPCCSLELLLDIIFQSIVVIGVFMIYLDFQPKRHLVGVYTNDYLFDKFIKYQINVFGFWITYKTTWIP